MKVERRKSSAGFCWPRSCRTPKREYDGCESSREEGLGDSKSDSVEERIKEGAEVSLSGEYGVDIRSNFVRGCGGLAKFDPFGGKSALGAEESSRGEDVGEFVDLCSPAAKASLSRGS